MIIGIFDNLYIMIVAGTLCQAFTHKTYQFKPENMETVHQMESYARKQENM